MTEGATSGRIAVLGAVGVLIGASATLGVAFAFVPALSAQPAGAIATAAPEPTEPTVRPPAATARTTSAAATSPSATGAPVTTLAPSASAAPIAAPSAAPAVPAARAAALQGHLPHDHDARDPYAPQAADAPLAKDVYESH